ncbi:MAG TPA: CoB--CoM heterodisulfide reductase iron-sulfur subunit A family protein [candidate division Zixibacteria bacterium]|nr:CoB--CoM heterodisulfide reductase iron-sulfur subunit A family protein [candidate division Zixibacteria bacterium]
MALFEPVDSQITADTLIVGGGVAGMTTAIESAEIGKDVILVEKDPSIGGRVARMFQYFPKMCPPTCGIEINLKRIRGNEHVRVLTLTEVENVTGEPGNFEVTLKISPRFVNEKCTGCGDCEKVCEIERDSDFNYGLDKTKAVYLPHLLAYPPRYVVDPKFVADPGMKKVAEACPYGAIDLDMQPRTITAKVGAIVWATGWKPYDMEKLENLGGGKIKNVIQNVVMERLASQSGPTQGKIQRPSDGKEISTIGFVQCAGSRDENHLPYCSTICCMASMKQATYVREQYPDAEIHLFYIDVRSPGRWEDFYVARQADEKFHFHRGKVARITECSNGNVILEAENTLTGEMTKTEVDMAVLATGMVPSNVDNPPPLGTRLDEFGFVAPDNNNGVIGIGVAARPIDVSASVQDGTGAALKAVIVAGRR